MRTLAAFVATVCVAVPAAWHWLDADIQSDGPATRPKVESFEVNGTTVTVELDRGILKAGGKLVAKLTATGGTKPVALDVSVQENMGYGPERVENPPREVAEKKLTLAPGKSVELPFFMGGEGKKGTVRWFDVIVSERRKLTGPDDTLASARTGAATWSGNSYPIAITPEGAVSGENAFIVDVTVKNTTSRPLQYLQIELGGNQLGYGGLDSQLYLGTANDYSDEDVRARTPYMVEPLGESQSDELLAPGASRTAKFTVTPLPGEEKAVAQYVFTAHASSAKGGAFDVITVKSTDAAPTPIAAK